VDMDWTYSWYLEAAKGMAKGTRKKAATLRAQTGLEGPLPSCGYEKGKLESNVRDGVSQIG
jgi:hypothetical protein